MIEIPSEELEEIAIKYLRDYEDLSGSLADLVENKKYSGLLVYDVFLTALVGLIESFEQSLGKDHQACKTMRERAMLALSQNGVKH